METKNILTILFFVACITAIPKTQVLAQEKISKLNDLTEFWEKYNNKCPDVITSFNNLTNAVLNKEGKLSIKEKQLIALGIAVSARCEYCIVFHTAGAMESGATEEEILEAASVAVYMGGGPALTNVKHVIDTIEELTAINESENTQK